MKIIVIDGQGGKIGKLIIEQVKKDLPDQRIIAIGTNSIATSAMLKAGADAGATGENPIIVNSSDADVIIGPIGIMIANSLLGEITPRMADAVSQSKGLKLLLPLNKCSTIVVGSRDCSLADAVKLVVAELQRVCK
ncbi:MAG TPA: DUF3842 family protein [Bacillota bacterium]|nr:DUF3842 family protein [Bacillota bacterium]HOH09498.1 DUF3842 family protein [Bacillota bacterium]HOS50389.1 DUF3842 family protein [Bacillota bacterium]HOY88485.1 DUF3842 family protein [Bacillota bacterium]HPI01675.1 DUF3842 family protein [Bacillota bacterium]